MNNHGVILRKRQQPGIGQPELDRYSQGERKKTFGYPKGQNTMFLDGRLLRDCVFPYLGLYLLATPPPITLDVGQNVNWQSGGIIPNESACYIMGVSSGPQWDAHDDMWAAWQLWVNGTYMDGANCGKWFYPIRKYIPPNSVATIYLRVFNNTINAAGIRLSLQCVLFNAALDVWDFGRADSHPNPTVAAVWP